MDALIPMFGDVKAAFDYLREGLRAIKEVKDVLPDRAKKDVIAEKITAAEDATRRAELEFPKSWGYHLYQCTFPPQIMLSIGFDEGKRERFQCPNCKKIQPQMDKPFHWSGFLWLLTDQFWSNPHLTVPQVSDGFLETAIHGPLCPQCKRDLTGLIRNRGETCICSMTIPVMGHLNSNYPVEFLRHSAYAEAQAAARRNEL